MRGMDEVDDNRRRLTGGASTAGLGSNNCEGALSDSTFTLRAPWEQNDSVDEYSERV
jgi:hypothetical protein